MGEEADYLRENDDYHSITSLVSQGIIPWYSVESSPTGKVVYRPKVKIGLDVDNKIQALMFLKHDYTSKPDVYVTLEFKAPEADVKLATNGLLVWLRVNGFTFDYRSNVYYKNMRNKDARSIQLMELSFRTLDKSMILVRTYIRNGCLRLGFSRQPLEKHKKRLRELSFRYNKECKDWVYTGLDKEEAKRKVVKYFSDQANIVLI